MHCLEKLTDSPESYVLNFCDNKDCKTYFSNERPLFTVGELENSEIFNILETEINIEKEFHTLSIRRRGYSL